MTQAILVTLPRAIPLGKAERRWCVQWALTPRAEFYSMSVSAEASLESDEAILGRVGRGDEAAFSELYDRFSGKLFGLIRQMIGDEKEAEDVLQEGFVYLWQHAAQYDRSKSKAFTWAVMIFRNKAIDRLRARGRRERLDERAATELPLISGTAPGADEAADSSDRGRIVRLALLSLPEEQRKLIEFAFLKGLTHHSIAESLGIPLGTVKTSIRRGLLRLRDLLKGGAR